MGFVVGGFDGDGAGGGSVFVGGFGAAVDDLAVVDEVFVGVGGSAGCCPKSEGDGGEDGCGDGFGIHGCFSFLVFLFPPYHSTHMIHKLGVGGVSHTPTEEASQKHVWYNHSS